MCFIKYKVKSFLVIIWLIWIVAPGYEWWVGEKKTYMSLVVQFIVGEFELVEADHLPHPGVPWGQRVRVDVGPRRHRGVCVPCHHPFGAVVHVPGRQETGLSTTRTFLLHYLTFSIKVDLQDQSPACPDFNGWTLKAFLNLNYVLSLVARSMVFVLFKHRKWSSMIGLTEEHTGLHADVHFKY